MANMLPPDWRRDPVGAGILLAAATAEAEWLKATSLTIPGGRPPGGWVGDPITSGYYSDGQTWGSGWRSNGAFDYARAVGDPSLNAIVDACIGAIASAFPEPPVRLYRPDAEGEPEALGDALPAVRLLRRPNPVHTWEELAGLIVAHEHVEGNAYLGKVRSAGGRVVELWPLPPDKVTPVPGGRTTNYVDHFAYKADDREPPQRLPPSEVVHLTLRRDPKMPWRGRSPLTSVLKHVFGDEEATSFMNAMLKNYGVPGALLTPDPAKGGVQLQMTQEQADKIKSRWMAATGGDRRGEPVVLASPMSVAVLGFNPQQLQLSDAQLTPEARICAALGVPPIVALQRVGLQNATYSNADQFYEGFTKFKMVPYWRLTAAQLTHQLLPDFVGEDSDLYYEHDLSEVGALQEDETALYERITRAVGGPWMTLNDGRRKANLPELPEGDIVYVPSSVTPTEPDALIPEPEPLPAPPVDGLLEAPAGGANGALPAPQPVAQPAPNGRAR